MFFVVLLPPAIPQAITRHAEFNQQRTLITPHSSELDAAKSDICNKQMAVAMPGPFCTSGQIYSILQEQKRPLRTHLCYSILHKFKKT